MPGPPIRRVVTGHDAGGRAIVAIDEAKQDERFSLVWTTEGFPVDNTTTDDGGARDVGITLGGGTVFRVGEIPAGGRSPMHRTNSVDYGILLSGELDMELDGGETAHLKAGDVVVQRGTNHAWVNNSDAPARMAWILIAAEPVKIGSRVLEPTM
ncbi:MAG TPA: cupin domain-containing protein [Dehalococcoidia bacterium]|jgi:quercetin dioxygenase-like cupin family protein|nr:cupin domain-containing protein [Dehalococcoidia bacterium]